MAGLAAAAAAFSGYCLLFIILFMTTKFLLNKIQNFPPSPFFCLPILGNLHLLKKPIHRTLFRLCRQHGPLLFLQFGSRRVLVVSSPALAEECLTKNDIVFANRPRLILGEHFGSNYTGLAWAPYGDHWRNLRRIASLELLSTNRLQLLSDIRLEEVKLLIRGLFRAQNQTVDMKTAFFELILNIMMRMIAGKRYYGENACDLEEAKRYRAIHAETFRLGGLSNTRDFLPWVRSKAIERCLMKCQRERTGFMQLLVDEQRKQMEIDCGTGSERKKNLIRVLLSLQETDPEYYTDEMITDLMLVLIMAATDTSTNTMEWALSLLLNHPHTLKKAQSEIDSYVGYDRLLNETDVAHLPYLQAIINETMRMYPGIAVLPPHESSKECTVGGHRIPGGTMLMVNTWAMQNDPNVWDNPGEFLPERFEGLKEAIDGFKLMPFGRGRRSCPGEGLALRVVGLALGSLIQCFEWERISNQMVDMSEGAGSTFPKAQPLKAVCRPRPSMLDIVSQI